jgi:hypothetical protein
MSPFVTNDVVCQSLSQAPVTSSTLPHTLAAALSSSCHELHSSLFTRCHSPELLSRTPHFSRAPVMSSTLPHTLVATLPSSCHRLHSSLELLSRAPLFFSLTVPSDFDEDTCFIVPDNKADATPHLQVLFKWDINNFFQDPGERQPVALETGFKFVSNSCVCLT